MRRYILLPACNASPFEISYLAHPLEAFKMHGSATGKTLVASRREDVMSTVLQKVATRVAALVIH